MNLTEIERQIQLKRQESVETLQFVPGIWVNGKYLWLQNCTEKVIYDEELIMKVKQEQIHSKIQFSSVYLSNHSNETKRIKVLMMHYFSNIDQDHLTFVSPTDHHIYHHAQNRVFLVNGRFHQADRKDYTVVPLWIAYADQVWRSIEKGELSYQPMAKGPAASIFAMEMVIAPHQTNKMASWAIAGSSKKEIDAMEKALLKNTLAFPFEK